MFFIIKKYNILNKLSAPVKNSWKVKDNYLNSSIRHKRYILLKEMHKYLLFTGLKYSLHHLLSLCESFCNLFILNFYPNKLHFYEIPRLFHDWDLGIRSLVFHWNLSCSKYIKLLLNYILNYLPRLIFFIFYHYNLLKTHGLNGNFLHEWFLKD